MGDTTQDPAKQLEDALLQLQELAKEDPELLKKKIWDTASAISFLVMEAKKGGFKPGWSANLKDAEGQSVFTKEDMELVEAVVDMYVKPLFSDIQKGGAKPVTAKPVTAKPVTAKPVVKPVATPVATTSETHPPIIPTLGGLVQEKKPSALPSLPINAVDVSMDVIFWKVKKFIYGLDDTVHKFSREMGPFKFFYDAPMDFRIPVVDPVVTPVLALIPIPPRIIPLLLEVIVETVRVIFSIGPQSNDLVRKLLSIVLAVIDVSKGNWKHAVLSMAGYFGKNPMLVGIVGKVFLIILQRVAPDILTSLVFTSYMSAKSLVIGTLTWVVTTFSPDFVRKSIGITLSKMNGPDGPLGKARAIIEQKMKSDPKYELRFKEVSESLNVSFDDLQNLQMIARQPAIMCSKDFQDSLDDIRMIPPIRLLFELCNIPTDPDTVNYVCGQFKNLPIEQTIQAGFDDITGKVDTPTVHEPAEIEAKPEAKEDEKKAVEAKPEAKKPNTMKSEAKKTNVKYVASQRLVTPKKR